MMGRLTGYDERDNGNLTQRNHQFPTSESRTIARNRSTTNTIPLHQNFNTTLPQISSPNYDAHRLQLTRTGSSLVESPLVEGRAQTSLQERVQPSFHESRIVRSCATSPTFKLPPIPSTKSSSTVKMPPQSISENLIPPFQDNTSVRDADKEYPSIADMKLAYENMMIGYFMPQSTKNENACLPETSQEQLQTNLSQYDYNTNSKSTPSHISHSGTEGVTYSSETVTLPYGNLPQELYQTLQANHMIQNPMSSQNHRIPQNSNITPQPNQHSMMNIAASTCSVIGASNLSEQEFFSNSESLSHNISRNSCGQLKQNYNSSSGNISFQASPKSFLPTSNVSLHDQSPSMSTVLNELSMLITPQTATEIDPIYQPNDINTIPSSAVTTSTVSPVTQSSNAVQNVAYQTKIDPNWGRFSVLPPVIPSTTPTKGGLSDGDNASLMSYASVSSNAQSAIQMGLYYNTVSPFSVNFSENIPSAFTTSPRYSARSSYSSRSRNKRALSNSPLSAEGIDINTIIRMSPTSLNAYLNGSRSSSSCVSPGSYGEKTGCYGHLSARNSSSSPQSGSGSSGNRQSASFTPQTGTPSNSNQSNITSDSSNISIACNNSEKIKDDFFNLEDNLFIMQAMQDLESGAGLPMPTSFHTNAQVASEYENLQVLPQDLAAFRTECYIPYVPAVLPPVHANIPSPYQPIPSQTLQALVPHTKPPPTYDQHMARKATLQKNNSSDSSQPSNSNSSSFESSEGDKTVAGSSSTDNESCRMYTCRWLDCAAIFQDQDEFVAHIEKVHIDQKKGDDFICFWKLCPRRLHPFNARYKLLVHMRIHSGDKPNKCTYAGCTKAFSRLENLKIHLRSHTGERPYSCTFAGCSKTFSNSSDRTKHQKTHHDTKPYVCQFAGCGKRYTDPSSLRKHVKKSHPDKKEPDRKKIRSAVEELDPKDLSECLVIHSIKPVTVYDASPPEPTDSGLGRSPRSSHPGSSSDHYPGIIYSGEGQGTSSQTSPSNQHSPPGPNEREKLPPNNNSLRVPILPPIAPSPVQQQCFPSLKSPAACNTPNLSRVTSSAASGISRSPSSVLQRTRLAVESGIGNVSSLYTDCSNNLNSRNSRSYASSIRNQSRDCS